MLLNWDAGKKIIPAQLNKNWVVSMDERARERAVWIILQDLGFEKSERGAVLRYAEGEIHLVFTSTSLDLPYTIEMYKGEGRKHLTVLSREKLKHWLILPSEIRYLWSTGVWITHGGSVSP